MQPRWLTGWVRCALCTVHVVLGGIRERPAVASQPVTVRPAPAQYFVWERPPTGVGGSQPATCTVVSPEKTRDKNICSVKVKDKASGGGRVWPPLRVEACRRCMRHSSRSFES